MLTLSFVVFSVLIGQTYAFYRIKMLLIDFIFEKQSDEWFPNVYAEVVSNDNKLLKSVVRRVNSVFKQLKLIFIKIDNTFAPKSQSIKNLIP